MMSRLTGGIGGRGPGETKLEINRRRARERIHALEQQIEQLGKRREQRRSLRTQERACRWCRSSATRTRASRRCSTRSRRATCSSRTSCSRRSIPTSRRLRFPREREIIITDTVGFIRDLPKDLVAAFRATLEELDEADLLLHVVDAADPAREGHIRAVERILEELKLNEKQRLIVFNKCDKLSAEQVIELAAEREQSIAVSAKDVRTTKPLLVAMERVLWREDVLKDERQLADVGDGGTGSSESEVTSEGLP